MAITTEPQQLLQLLAFMSPAFPIGGFAYSHGLERAIDDGAVTSAAEVREWIESLLVHGGGFIRGGKAGLHQAVVRAAQQGPLRLVHD